jgi:hypothetical protein
LPKKVTHSDSNTSEALTRDITLLKEYGFKRKTISSPELNLKKIDRFGMRQLDRLKLILYRNEFLIGSFPKDIRAKIEMNDLHAFAAALSILSQALVERW